MPPIAQHGHNRVPGAQLPCSAHGTDAVERSRATDEEPLLSGTQPVSQSASQSVRQAGWQAGSEACLT